MDARSGPPNAYGEDMIAIAVILVIAAGALIYAATTYLDTVNRDYLGSDE